MDVALGLLDDGHRGLVEVEGEDQGGQVDRAVREERGGEVARLREALLQGDEEGFVGEAVDLEVLDEGEEVAEEEGEPMPALLVLKDVAEDDGEVAAVRLQVGLAGDGGRLLGELGVEIEDGNRADVSPGQSPPHERCDLEARRIGYNL